MEDNYDKRESNHVDFTGATPPSGSESARNKKGAQRPDDAGNVKDQIERDRQESGEFGFKEFSAAEIEIANRAAFEKDMADRRARRTKMLKAFGYQAKKMGVKGLIATVMLTGMVAGGALSYAPSDDPTRICVVDDKEKVYSENSGTKLRIHATCAGEEQTFETRSAVFIGKFKSRDRYDAIKVGEAYTFETVGKTIPLLMPYPNILESTHIPTP